MAAESYRVIITEGAGAPADLADQDIWIHGVLALKGVLPAATTGLLTWGEAMRAAAVNAAPPGYPGLGRLALGEETGSPDLRFELKGDGLVPEGWFAVFPRCGPEELGALLAEVQAA